MKSIDLLEIRPFSATTTDYAAIIKVDNTVWPDNQMALDDLKYNDENRDANYLYQRLMMTWQDEIVGFAHYRENPYSYQEGKYHITIEVLPEYEGRGIGTAVYAQACGKTQILTTNEENNPMYDLNVKLGFCKLVLKQTSFDG